MVIALIQPAMGKADEDNERSSRLIRDTT